MSLESLIYERKSCRKYRDDEISQDEFDKISDFVDKAAVLDESIDFEYEILRKDDVNLKTRWSAPYYLSIYSQNRNNYKENVGFVFQQVSLYMQSLGIGNCWVGMGQPNEKRDDFVILISFGRSDDISRNLDQFKRKDISKFSDFEDDRLKPAYYAPSAGNSQPWYFKHSDDGFDVYQDNFNPIKRKLFGKMNPIDLGIGLSHLYIANPETFKYEVKDDFEDLRGYTYNCSVSF